MAGIGDGATKLRHEPGAVQGLIRSLAYHRSPLPKGSQRHRQATTELGYFRNKPG